METDFIFLLFNLVTSLFGWLVRATRGSGVEKLCGDLTYGPHPMT